MTTDRKRLSIFQPPTGTFWLILSALAVTIGAVYFYILRSHPYIAGSDLIYHTWFTQQILDHHAIPLTQPTQNVASIYALTPFFHIFNAMVAAITHVPLTTLLPLLTIPLVMVFIFCLGYLAKTLTGRSSLGILAVLIYFLIQPSFFEYLPRNFAVVTFLLLLVFLLKYFQRHVALISIWLLPIALSVVVLAFTHLFIAAYAFTILAVLLLAFAKFLGQRKKVLAVFAIVVFAGVLILARSLTQHSLNNLNLTDNNQGSFLVSPVVTSAMTTSTAELFTSGFWMIFFILGVVGVGIDWVKNGPTTRRITLAGWLLAGLLLYLQSAAGFNFVPDRAFILTQPAAAIFAAVGLSWVFSSVFRVFIVRQAAWLVVVFLATMFSLRPFTGANYSPIENGVSRAEVQEYARIAQTLPNGTVISDPITMYMLTSLADLQPAYPYDHTDLTKRRFMLWPEVHSTFTVDDAAFYNWLVVRHPNYFAISYETPELIDNANLRRISDNPRFRLIYQSRVISSSTGRPLFRVYAIDTANLPRTTQ